MSDESALVPVEQKAILFYEDEITAVRTQDGSVFVPVRPIVERLGLSWSGQRERINRDAVLSAEAATVRVTRTEGDRQRVSLSVRPLCDCLCVTWPAQHRLISRYPLRSDVQSTVAVTITDGRMREEGGR